MPSIGAGCHELRVTDKSKSWRLFYALRSDAIVILEVTEKKTQQTPKAVIDTCKTRLKSYENYQKSPKK
jgi:phage-related protein